MADDPSDRSTISSTDDTNRPPSSDADGERPDPYRNGNSGRAEGSDENRPAFRSDPIGWVRWLWSADRGAIVFFREILTSVVVVLTIGAVLFAVSGVWPPMVAIESGSMDPHLQKGDLVFVMDETRLPPDAATGDTGVVTYENGRKAGYRSFGSYGDVIIYHPDGDPNRKPVIHRAHLWVEEGDRWVDRADPAFVSGDDCDAVPNCPAPHDGFITKGDNAATNDYYDQTRGISSPVKPEWIAGSAEVRIPWLGWVRLTVAEMKFAITSFPSVPGAQGPA